MSSSSLPEVPTAPPSPSEISEKAATVPLFTENSTGGEISKMVNMSEFFRKNLPRVEKRAAETRPAVQEPPAKKARVKFMMNTSPIFKEEAVSSLITQVEEVFHFKTYVRSVWQDHHTWAARLVCLCINVVSRMQDLDGRIIMLKTCEDRALMRDIIEAIVVLRDEMDAAINHLIALEKDVLVDASGKVLLFVPGSDPLFLSTDVYNFEEKVTFQIKRRNPPPPDVQVDDYFIEARRYSLYDNVCSRYMYVLEDKIKYMK